ncbi:hypothetical protein CDL12_21604 [Handroanthus impetiginosus]|uniref:Uncharacterized protein n=1 Tax=Handroanthus impetiginosus TaxID=429701 RepID=A0A2G9GKW5_9LAMI|nr:hypothetical protein CDL12_21604 [Handroanthus impetiginosus]
MRRSLGGGAGGRGMGGGGGGGMIRTVQRAIRAGVGGGSAEPFSTSGNTTTIARGDSRKGQHFNKNQPTSPNSALTLSSSSSSAAANDNGSSPFSSVINFPVSAASGAAAPSWGPSSSCCSEDSEWGYVEGSEDEWAHIEDFVFGSVPSRDEVHHAVSALQQVLSSSSYMSSPKEKLPEDIDAADEVPNQTGYKKKTSSPVEPKMDWIEPSWDLCNSRAVQSHRADKVYDAFHLLQTEPSVQRMVVSLSSDKAVWDAVLNNEVVKELRGSITSTTQADNLLEESSGEGSDDSNPVKDILSWIVGNAKAKIMQLIDNITKLMNEVFQPPKEEKKDNTTNPFEEKLKTSLLLSVVVLMIVVITRAQSA